MKRGSAALIAILAVAIVLRVHWNDVSQYSPADESVYTSYTQHLLDRGFAAGYPEIVRWFDDPRMWRYPNPLRFGHLALTTAAAEIYGAAEPRALAWLSTVAGILVVPLLYLLASRLFDRRTGLLAAAFGAVSAIEIAMGRRALQDEVFCAAVLIALILVIQMMERGNRWDIAAAVAALSAALAIKESLLLLDPAFAAVILAYRKFRPRHLLLFALPPIVDYTAFSVLAHDFRAWFSIGRRVWGATASEYVLQYQGGPPHRLLIDFFATAPFVSLLAAAAVAVALLGRDHGPRIRALALFAVVSIGVLAIIPSKNLRFAIMIDPVVQILAAWLLAVPAATGRALSSVALTTAALANGAIEIELFHVVFIRGGVYDPVTATLLQSLGAVPHSTGTADAPLLFPWICAALFAIAWLVERARMRSAPHP